MISKIGGRYREDNNGAPDRRVNMGANEFALIMNQLEKGKTAALTRNVEGIIYTREFMPSDRLIILGGGHIAQPLCKIASMLDFSVTVVDDRPSFANSARFPEADTVVCDSFSNAITGLEIRAGDYVCVITRGHRWDGDCLRQILPGTLPSYLGMIGSKRRVAGLLALLEEEGFSREAIAHIHAPIGLKIGAVTTTEIAVSICAELVAHRRKMPERKAGAALAQADVNLDLLRFLAEGPEPRAMMLVLDSKGSTPAKPGAMMAADCIGTTYGTIGGGCGEAAVISRAREIIGSGVSDIIDVDMTNDMAAEEGMVCGGTMRVLIEDIK